MRFEWLAIAVFLLVAGLAWMPFDHYTVLYKASTSDTVPAGEIDSGFMLVQEVRPPSADVEAGDLSQPCFAIRFATYARHNNGRLRVYWRQGQQEQWWPVEFDDLADNTYRHFCPDTAFSPYRSFRVEVHGVSGKPGRSATLWLVDDTRFGRATMPSGQGPQGKAIALQGSTRQHIGPAGMARIDHGAWLIGWLCTLVIGITAMFVGLRGARDAGQHLA
jgi:hypothetical protein